MSPTHRPRARVRPLGAPASLHAEREIFCSSAISGECATSDHPGSRISLDNIFCMTSKNPWRCQGLLPGFEMALTLRILRPAIPGGSPARNSRVQFVTSVVIIMESQRHGERQCVVSLPHVLFSSSLPSRLPRFSIRPCRSRSLPRSPLRRFDYRTAKRCRAMGHIRSSP